MEYTGVTLSTWKLFYDGGCNLCHSSQLRAERWARRAAQPLEIDVLASDEAIKKGYGDVMIVEADGKVFRADQAWFKLAALGPWYVRWMAPLNGFAPTRALIRWGYNLVVKHRTRFFGTRECAVPPKTPQE